MERDKWLAWYAARNLATIPLVPCGKRPLRHGWQRPDPAAWRDAPPDANLGVLCGKSSGGLVVLDFDTLHGVHDASGMRAEELAVHTLVARTARGWHVYARDADVRTHSPWKGLDVRAEGSMVVAPPSIHPSRTKYQFVQPDAPIATLASLSLNLTPNQRTVDNLEPIDWTAIDSLIQAQAPKLREQWRLLRKPTTEFDRSRADFALARCLWEAGYAPGVVASILVALPGSKARERGLQYALRTALRAGKHS